MTRPALILGISAAFVLSLLPLAVSAGAAHSGYRPATWQRSHDGQGVMRVYGGDVYRTPEAYAGGEFRGGLNVQTASEYAETRDERYSEEYYEDSDRYVAPQAPCRSVCVTAYAPPPPPPCVTEARREVRYAGPRVASRAIVVEEEESRDDYREYHRSSSRDYDDRRNFALSEDCPCHHAHHDDRYDDRHDDRYDDRHDDDYRGRGSRDVFGRY